jgi:hypothetical protein
MAVGAMEQELAPFLTDGKLELPMETLIATGLRP